MNKLCTRWAASIAGLAVTSSVHAAEQLSLPELRLILTGNQQSDIAGQFNNFASSENVSDILTIIGQFFSVSGPRK